MTVNGALRGHDTVSDRMSVENLRKIVHIRRVSPSCQFLDDIQLLLIEVSMRSI